MYVYSAVKKSTYVNTERALDRRMEEGTGNVERSQMHSKHIHIQYTYTHKKNKSEH
jgi:hypothetical protein